MSRSAEHKIKLLVLWDILCKNTDEDHAMNSDEIREELAKRGINVIRRVVASDIAALNDYGYEVLSYKKKYYYYYVVNRPIETAEVVLLADVIRPRSLRQRKRGRSRKSWREHFSLIRLTGYQKILFPSIRAERGTVLSFTM